MSLYHTVSKFPTLQNLLLSSTYVICYCIRINWNSASTNREKSAKKMFSANFGPAAPNRQKRGYYRPLIGSCIWPIE